MTRLRALMAMTRSGGARPQPRAVIAMTRSGGARPQPRALMAMTRSGGARPQPRALMAMTRSGGARLQPRAAMDMTRWARMLVMVAVLLLGGSSTALACPMCFGAEETGMIAGTKLGVLVMLGITLTVQGGFAGFFLYLRRRARRNADAELDSEWSELQKPSRTT